MESSIHMATKKQPQKKTTVRRETAKRTKPVAAPKKAEPAAPKAERVVLTVQADPGSTVYLAGSFNNWDPTGKKMLEKKGKGVYAVAIKLVPGTYQYKFVIDGTWCADPENRDFVQNDHGTLNSVITVK